MSPEPSANVCSSHSILDNAQAKLVHCRAAEAATTKIAADGTAENWFCVVEFKTATRP